MSDCTISKMSLLCKHTFLTIEEHDEYSIHVASLCDRRFWANEHCTLMFWSLFCRIAIISHLIAKYILWSVLLYDLVLLCYGRLLYYFICTELLGSCKRSSCLACPAVLSWHLHCVFCMFLFRFLWLTINYIFPRVGPGCVLCPRINPLRFLAGCRRRRLNQGFVVALGFFSLLDRAYFGVIFFGLWVHTSFSSLSFCYQYQCNWLPVKIRPRNDLLCVEWDVKPCSTQLSGD